MKNQYGVHYSRQEYREEYLKTEEWKIKSQFILNRDKECVICNKSRASDAHHLTYENLPFENLDKDIVGVCRNCHNKIHSWEVTSKCREVRHIKKLLKLMSQKIKITHHLVVKMNSLNINAKKYLSGLFNKNLYHFDEFIGVKIPFRKYLKIKDFIKSFENKKMPKIPHNVKRLRQAIEKSKKSWGKGGWSRKIL